MPRAVYFRMTRAVSCCCCCCCVTRALRCEVDGGMDVRPLLFFVLLRLPDCVAILVLYFFSFSFFLFFFFFFHLLLLLHHMYRLKQ